MRSRIKGLPFRTTTIADQQPIITTHTIKAARPHQHNAYSHGNAIVHLLKACLDTLLLRKDDGMTAAQARGSVCVCVCATERS